MKSIFADRDDCGEQSAVRSVAGRARIAPACLLLALLAAPAPAPATEPPPQPYAGEAARPIKALSAEEADGLLAGAGLGYAKAAELNGWPGPLHALELADDLDLTDGQIAQLRAVRREMLETAQPLGAALIDAERTIDALFAEGTPRPDTVVRATAAASAIEGRLRAAHLVAHIATRDILSRHQRMLYASARGYTPAHGDGHHHR